jgi:hypothetical protein
MLCRAPPSRRRLISPGSTDSDDRLFRVQEGDEGEDREAFSELAGHMREIDAGFSHPIARGDGSGRRRCGVGLGNSIPIATIIVQVIAP